MHLELVWGPGGDGAAAGAEGVGSRKADGWALEPLVLSPCSQAQLPSTQFLVLSPSLQLGCHPKRVRKEGTGS